jgi:hypothetical protein
MAETDRLNSFGTLLQQGDGETPETFTTIANVGDIDGPDMSLDTEEVTNHGSEDGWDEHEGTILRGGEVGFPINYLPTESTHDMETGLQADMINRVRRNYRLIYPDADENGYQFKGIVTGFKPKAPVKGILRSDIKFKLTGPVTAL